MGVGKEERGQNWRLAGYQSRSDNPVRADMSEARFRIVRYEPLGGVTGYWCRLSVDTQKAVSASLLHADSHVHVACVGVRNEGERTHIRLGPI